jgi:hypothetical protein
MHKSTITRIQSEPFLREPAYLNFLLELMCLKNIDTIGLLDHHQYPIYFLANTGYSKKGKHYWTEIMEKRKDGELFRPNLFYQEPHNNV